MYAIPIVLVILNLIAEKIQHYINFVVGARTPKHQEAVM
jgi:hypothetical protein